MKQLRSTTITLALVLLMAMFAMATGASAADESVIDFEGLTEGNFISSLSSGNGISGPAGAGYVEVHGHNNNPNPNYDPSWNAAMIFDATCTPNCVNDSDLYSPANGNVMVITENFEQAYPNDSQFGGYLGFGFANFGAGSVEVSGLTIIDTEEGGHIEFWANGAIISTQPIPNVANGVVQTLAWAPVSGVEVIMVYLNGSGAVDNILVSTTPPGPIGGEGCTPGYWKVRQHLDSWQVYSPDQTVNSVFNSPYFGSSTLLDALQGGGGRGAEGGAKILLRAAVAALLNTVNTDVAYVTNDAAALIAAVNDALATGDKDAMTTLAGQLDAYNNGGCPLN